ncbi:hypothetical protein DFR30_2427 [Thiogranum longum]|uniref:Uncharacterized protein n=1 Tax=Thiogranum longum TaxID=1537524 RepID=A0A4R1HPC7_9GAMM|nr:hypothetical protein [Thiogranum longum]TCK19132.1 hypothetical protein DFR30_2427 [Thiogranum longum]
MNQRIILFLTLMLSGRAMTLAFIHRVGGGMPGDPPPAWLMPLVGDAVIGVTGLWVAYLILRKTGMWVWTVIIVWNSLAVWDALSAFAIQTTNPWPEFFMIKLMGSSMFFAASAMHVAIIVLACRPDMRKRLTGPVG